MAAARNASTTTTQERPRSFPPLVRQDHRHADGPRPARAADGVLRLARRQRRLEGPRRRGARPPAAPTCPRSAASRRSSRRSRRSRTSSETMQLSFTNPYLEPEKYSIEECKERGKTYAAPLYVEAEFMNHQTGEIKTQTVFMGDFPLRPARARSSSTAPSVSSSRSSSARPASTSTARPTRPPTRTSLGAHHPEPRCLARVRDRQARPGRRAHRPQAQAVGHRLPQGPRPHERGHPRRVRRLRLDRGDARRRTRSSPRRTRSRDIYRKLRPGEQVAAEAARALLDNFYFNPKRYDLAKVGRYKINQKLGLDGAAVATRC